jgi:cytochrome b561
VHILLGISILYIILLARLLITHKQAVRFIRSQVPIDKNAGSIIHSILHTSFIITVCSTQ